MVEGRRKGLSLPDGWAQGLYCPKTMLTLLHPSHPPTNNQQATSASFDLLAPFCEAGGRGSPASALAATATPQHPTAAAYMYGAERLSAATPDRNAHGHPGELAAAEGFARGAQQRMLAAGMPAGAELVGIRVAVTVHVSLDTFIYSQPIVFCTETPAGELSLRAPFEGRRQFGVGGSALRSHTHPTHPLASPTGVRAGREWVVHCHVHPHWEYYQPGMESMLKPMSPQYFLKLKKGGVVALVR